MIEKLFIDSFRRTSRLLLLSLTAVYLQSDVRHVLRRLDDTSESTPAVVHSSPDNHHLQVRRQPNATENILPHLLGQPYLTLILILLLLLADRPPAKLRALDIYFTADRFFTRHTLV